MTLVGAAVTVSFHVSSKSGCIVSGCLCNLDVRREAKFSIMMWSNAIKTLVYSLLCLYFGKNRVYTIKCLEDFHKVYRLILCSGTFGKQCIILVSLLCAGV